MDKSLVKRVKGFPPLDETVLKIQEITNKKDSSIKELANVVEKDPMLTANILKATNSPLYGFSREIKNITQAISLFGMATIRGFAMASMMQSNIKMNLSPYNLSKQKFLNISLTQNALMFSWYSKVDRSKMDILMPASFLIEIGKIVISDELINEKKDKSFSEDIKDRKTALEISELEEEYVNTTSEDVTAAILEHWNLEPVMVSSIKYSSRLDMADEDVKEFAVALSVVKSAVNIFGNFSQEGLQDAFDIIEENSLDREKFVKALEKLRG